MSEFDLTPIARLDSYRGLVFGSLAADVTSLREHLGAATALIDIFVAPAPQELEIVAGFSIYQTACNWKIMHENGPDAYHAPVVHNNFAQAVHLSREARDAQRRHQDRHRSAHRAHRIGELRPRQRPHRVLAQAPRSRSIPDLRAEGRTGEALHARSARMDHRPRPAHDDLPQPAAQRSRQHALADLPAIVGRPHGNHDLVHRAGRRTGRNARSAPAQIRRLLPAERHGNAGRRCGRRIGAEGELRVQQQMDQHGPRQRNSRSTGPTTPRASSAWLP